MNTPIPMTECGEKIGLDMANASVLTSTEILGMFSDFYLSITSDHIVSYRMKMK